MEDLANQKIFNSLKRMTNHSTIELTPSGDSAIFDAIYLAKAYFNKKNPESRTTVLIPDQAGWISYKEIPKNQGLDIVEVKTKDGIISISDLDSKIDSKTVCFIYVNPAGYFAQQPALDIYEVCKGRCLVIMDCSGSIGTNMCNGDNADMIVGSFGRWKPINLKYGGFVSVKDQDVYSAGKEVFDLAKFDEKYAEDLLKKIEDLPQRYALFEKHRKKIINDLRELKVLYPDKKGINVIVKFDSEPEKNLIINYCKENGYEFTLCPRYIRVESNAVSVEVKRL